MSNEIPRDGNKSNEKIGEGKKDQPERALERIKPVSDGTPSVGERVPAVPSSERIRAVQPEQKRGIGKIPAAPPEGKRVVQPEQTSSSAKISAVPTAAPRPSVVPPHEPLASSPPLAVTQQEKPQLAAAQASAGEGEKDSPPASGFKVTGETPPPADQPIPVEPASQTLPLPAAQTESGENEAPTERVLNVTGETSTPPAIQPKSNEQLPKAIEPPKEQVLLSATDTTRDQSAIGKDTVSDNPLPGEVIGSEGPRQLASSTGQQSESVEVNVPQTSIPEGTTAIGQAGQPIDPLGRELDKQEPDAAAASLIFPKDVPQDPSPRVTVALPSRTSEEKLVSVPHAACGGSGCSDCHGNGFLLRFESKSEKKDVYAQDKKLPNEVTSLNVSRHIKENDPGDILRQLRRNHGVRVEQISEKMDLDETTIRKFETGTRKIDLNRIYNAAIACGLGPAIEEMQELDQLRRSQNWQRLLIQPGMTVGRAIDNLRLANHVTIAEFAWKIGIPKESLNRKIAGTENPELPLLNKIIEASVIDTQSKEAQLIRLMRYGILPMSVDDLILSSKGNDIRYFRIANGATQKNLSEKLYYSEGSIVFYESGGTISEKAVNAYCDWLGLSHNDVMRRVMVQRAQGVAVSLSKEERAEILRGRYLFREHLQQLGKYWLSPKEEDDLTKAKELGESRKILRSIREKNKMSLRVLSAASGISLRTLANIESGATVPESTTIIKWLKGEVAHPFILFLLDLARKERQERESKAHLDKEE